MKKKGLEIKKILFSTLIIIQIIALLAFSSYSWLINSWSPSITQQEIEIETAGDMVIGLTGENGDSVYNTVSINKIAGVDSFRFKQVSSVNGQDFFWLDYTPTMEGNEAVLKRANAAEHGYIDVDFCLITDDSINTSKYVYLHHETSIYMDPKVAPLVNVPAAIRVAVTFKGTAVQGGQDKSWIFGIERENIVGKTNIANPITMSAVPTADNKTINDVTATAPQPVNQFNDFNGGRGYNPATDIEDPEKYPERHPVDSDKVLHVMAPGEVRWVNVKIWLEGGSFYCNEYVAGQKFNLILKFGSSNVL